MLPLVASVAGALFAILGGMVARELNTLRVARVSAVLLHNEVMQRHEAIRHWRFEPLSFVGMTTTGSMPDVARTVAGEVMDLRDAPSLPEGAWLAHARDVFAVATGWESFVIADWYRAKVAGPQAFQGAVLEAMYVDAVEALQSLTNRDLTERLMLVMRYWWRRRPAKAEKPVRTMMRGLGEPSPDV